MKPKQGLNISRKDAKRCVGEGWSGLIDEIFDSLPDDAYIFDIKEKWGGLRFYVYGADDDVWRVIDEAERRSYEICEICGSPGRPRTGGWIKTLCDRHAAEGRKGADV